MDAPLKKAGLATTAFGLSSIVAPILGAILSAGSVAHGPAGYEIFWAPGLSSLCGFGCAIAAWKLRERYWGLWVIGLLLNSAVALLVVISIFGSADGNC